MIREASESVKYTSLLIGLILIGIGLVDPNIAIVPIVFGAVIILLASYDMATKSWRDFNEL